MKTLSKYSHGYVTHSVVPGRKKFRVSRVGPGRVKMVFRVGFRHSGRVIRVGSGSGHSGRGHLAGFACMSFCIVILVIFKFVTVMRHHRRVEQTQS